MQQRNNFLRGILGMAIGLGCAGLAFTGLVSAAANPAPVTPQVEAHPTYELQLVVKGMT